MSNSTLSALRRRLEKWELQHLRTLAAELRERLDRAEDDASRAWESSEFWQCNATDIQLELMEADYTVGLTKDGQIVVEKTGTQESAQGIRPTLVEAFAPSSDNGLDQEVAGNTPAGWLKTLVWDGKPRVEQWLVNYLGVANTPHARNVGKYFLVAMVARALTPGCWFPFCLVLEGEQATGKSRALEILAGGWYCQSDFDLNDKDFLSALRGKWVCEFAEMGAVTRAESTKQKSFLSRQFDTYRSIFERRETHVDRQVVFAGTTNDTGTSYPSMFFWPVKCSQIDLQALAANRSQLFAEAVALFKADQEILSRLRVAYPSATLASSEITCSGDAACPNWRRAIVQHGPIEPTTASTAETITELLKPWVQQQKSEFSIADAAKNGLMLDESNLTRDLKTRVGIALRKIGCQMVMRRGGDSRRYMYRFPGDKSVAWPGGNNPAHQTADWRPLTDRKTILWSGNGKVEG